MEKAKKQFWIEYIVAIAFWEIAALANNDKVIIAFFVIFLTFMIVIKVLQRQGLWFKIDKISWRHSPIVYMTLIFSLYIMNMFRTSKSLSSPTYFSQNLWIVGVVSLFSHISYRHHFVLPLKKAINEDTEEKTEETVEENA